jgi:F0F1-type ATP synthase membrane subunit a
MLVLGNNFLMIGHIVPLVVLIGLMFLEFGVAIIQSYVFTILTCIYLCDAVHLH